MIKVKLTEEDLNNVANEMFNLFRENAEKLILANGGHYVTEESQISNRQKIAIKEMTESNKYHDIIADIDGLTIYCFDYKKNKCIPFYLE